MDNFQELFLASLRDGSYSDGLREKVNGLRDKRHLWSLKCIQDTKSWIDSAITKSTVYPVVISDNGWTPYLKWEEMANTILNCKQLGQSRDQPSYYPPVLAYTHPHSISGTPTQIKTLKEQKEKENATFVDHNVTVTRSPMTVNEFEKLWNSGNIQLFNWLHIFWKDIAVITGFQRNERFSYPIITDQIGYRISLLINTEKNTQELAGIYVFQNSKILSLLLEQLTDLHVSNPDDLMEAQITLRELYFSITPKP